MSAMRAVFRSELQHRWRSWLALMVLVTLVGGTVLAAAAAGRRTASAFPRFISRYGFDAEVANFPGYLPPLRSLPGVTSVSHQLSYLTGNLSIGGQIVPEADAYVFEPALGLCPHDQARGRPHARRLQRGACRFQLATAIRRAPRLCRDRSPSTRSRRHTLWRTGTRPRAAHGSVSASSASRPA